MNDIIVRLGKIYEGRRMDKRRTAAEDFAEFRAEPEPAGKGGE